MSINIDHPLNYIGMVSVSAVNGKTTFYKYSSHNAGTSALFQGLCNLLAGNSYSSQKSYMPQFIRLYNKTNSNTSPLSTAVKYNAAIQVKPVTVNNESSYVTVLHFVVPQNLISREDGKINYLQLFGENENGGATDNPLANFEIEDGAAIDPNTFTNNTQYIVEWSLGFSNSSTNITPTPTIS